MSKYKMLGIVGALIALLASPALAAPNELAPPGVTSTTREGPHREHSLAVFAHLGLYGFSGGSAPGIPEAGFGVNYVASRHFALEMTLAKGLEVINVSPKSAVRTGQRTTTGVDQRWLGIVRLPTALNGVALSFGAGPMLLTSGDFGTVALVALDVAIEVRAASGFYFVTGTSAYSPLHTSRTPLDPSSCAEKSCSRHFEPGQVGAGARFGAGWAF